MQNSQNTKRGWKARQLAAFRQRRSYVAATTNERF